MRLYSPLAMGGNDASSANGGAIDGVLRPFSQPEYALAVVVLGFCAAQFRARTTLASLAAFAVTLVVSSALGLLAGAHSDMRLLMFVGVVAALVAAFIGERAGWLCVLGAMLMGVGMGGSQAGSVAARGDYSISFVAAFCVVSIGISWMALTVAFMVQRRPRGTTSLRAVSAVAVVLAAARALIQI